MAIIRTDPSQGKTIAALLAVLALAVGVTVYRVQITQSVRAGVIQTPVATEVSVRGISQIGVVGRPARNPFKKPAVLLSDATSSSAGSSAVPMLSGMAVGMPLPPNHQGLQPLSVAPMMTTSPNETQDSQSVAQDAELPTFVLMATVLTNGKSSAVLRIGDTEVKVVRIGDMVDGRFRLCSLMSDHAELSDGTTKVIAKRGRIEDEKTKGL
jgi:hypothetical protein